MVQDSERCVYCRALNRQYSRSLGMRGRSSGTDGTLKTAFGQRITGGLERAFDLRDPYKLNRAPMLRGGKRRLTSIGSIVCALLGIALLVGIGVFIGRELVRPPKRLWEGGSLLAACIPSYILQLRNTVPHKPWQRAFVHLLYACTASIAAVNGVFHG